jgi:hypothetical protein
MVEHDDPPRRSRTSVWAVLTLIALVVFAAPWFVCMPVTNDVSYYDIQARTALTGGVLYRDMVEPNFPGVVWVHMLVRSTCGWSTEAIRAFDLAVVCAILVTLGLWMRQGVWLAALLLLIYVSVSEWCHVQRDMWLLLPVMLALHVRGVQWRRGQGGETSGWRVFAIAVLEGVCWGAAVWIKPHVMSPAAAVWLMASTQTTWRRWGIELAGLVCGGLAMGVLGVALLVHNGAWPWFLEQMLEWNPEYVAITRHLWTQQTVMQLLVRMFPYWLVHLWALPIAVGALLSRSGGAEALWRRRALAAVYVSSLLQAALLQHPYDYIHLPPVLLGVTVVFQWVVEQPSAVARRTLLRSFAAACVVASPLISATHWSAWLPCLQEGSTPELRDRLAKIPYPGWRDLRKVEQFLLERGAGNREITCWSNCMAHVYRDLGLEPSTRFVYPGTHLTYFRSRRDAVEQALISSPQKYVLSNLMEAGLLEPQAREIGPEGPLGFPPKFPPQLRKTYPWKLPVLYRAGMLMVHEVPQRPRRPETARTPSAVR